METRSSADSPAPAAAPPASLRPEHQMHGEKVKGQGDAHAVSGDDHGPLLPADLPKVGTGAVLIASLAFLLLLGGFFILGYLPYRQRQKEVRADAAAVRSATPVVNVIMPKKQASGSDLMLPADVQAYQRTSIFPRTNGYLKKLLVDIGDHVESGQLLAEIDTPEVDAQLNQARANAQNAQANIAKMESDLALAKLTLDRYIDVANTSGVTQQQVDEKRTQFNQAKANLDSAKAGLKSTQAEVQRLEALQSFEKVMAPFAGTITARNVDVGALLSPTNGAGREMLQIDQVNVLRVFINVPQSYSTAVRMGQKAELLVRNYPGVPFEGKVVRTAGAIDQNTRTLRVEVDVANRENKLFAGMYGMVRLEIQPPTPPLVVPTSALVYNADGLSVATVASGRVHFQKISVGRDFGNELEVSNGLNGDEWVVANPGEHLVEGIEVRTILPEKTGVRLAESAH